MNVLGIDLGTRHTGVAICDTTIGVPLPLDTIQHTSENELIDALLLITEERAVQHIVFGLPYLLSGDEGSQAEDVRGFVEHFPFPKNVEFSFVDERYSNANITGSGQDHSSAACAILQVFQDRLKSS